MRDEEFHTAVVDLLNDWAATVAAPEVVAGPRRLPRERRGDPPAARLPRPDRHPAPACTTPTARSGARSWHGSGPRGALAVVPVVEKWDGDPYVAHRCATWPSASTGARTTWTSTRWSTSHRRRRPAGLAAAVYGASEGLTHGRGRGRGDRRPGRHQLDDPQLPRLPARHLGDAAGPAGTQPGDPLRHPLLHRLAGDRSRGRRTTAHRTSCAPRAATSGPAPW